jgi:hypothetical protein
MKFKFSIQELVTIGIFGALWGAIEISAGSILHSLNVPMTGMFLSAGGLLVAMVGRSFVPRFGSTLFIGVTAMLMKMFSLGGVVIWPMLAIFMEALIAEVALTTLRKPRLAAFAITGALGVFYTMVHPFFSQGLLAGNGVLFVWEMLLEEGTRIFGIPLSAAILVIAMMASLRVVVGGLAGVLAWNVSKAVHQRLGDAASLSIS